MTVVIIRFPKLDVLKDLGVNNAEFVYCWEEKRWHLCCLKATKLIQPVGILCIKT